MATMMMTMRVSAACNRFFPRLESERGPSVRSFYFSSHELRSAVEKIICCVPVTSQFVRQVSLCD